MKDINEREKDLLFYLLYNENAAKDSRDVGPCTKIRSILWGVGQNQPVSTQNNRQYNLTTGRVLTGHAGHLNNGRNIPTFSADVFHWLPTKVQEYLFSWMELGQTITQRYWDQSALGDRARNYAFARKLNERMGRKI